MRIVITLGSTLALSGCSGCSGHHPATVTATCEHVESFHSNLGTVNVPLYPLGKVLMISGKDGEQRAYGAGTLKFAPTGSDSTPINMSDTIDAKFDLAFDTKVTDAVKAQAEAHLGHTVDVELTGVRRVDLPSPAAALANLDPAVKQLIVASADDKEKLFVVVSSLKRADSLELKLANNIDGKVDANVVKYADVELKVTYRCDGILKLVGKGAPAGVFYGVTPLRYNKQLDVIEQDDQAVEPWRIDHSNAFAP